MGRVRKSAVVGGAWEERRRLWGNIAGSEPGAKRDEQLARATGAVMLATRARTLGALSTDTRERLYDERREAVDALLADGFADDTVSPISAEALDDKRLSEEYWADMFPKIGQTCVTNLT